MARNIKFDIKERYVVGQMLIPELLDEKELKSKRDSSPPTIAVMLPMGPSPELKRRGVPRRIMLFRWKGYVAIFDIGTITSNVPTMNHIVDDHLYPTEDVARDRFNAAIEWGSKRHYNDRDATQRGFYLSDKRFTTIFEAFEDAPPSIREYALRAIPVVLPGYRIRDKRFHAKRNAFTAARDELIEAVTEKWREVNEDKSGA